MVASFAGDGSRTLNIDHAGHFIEYVLESDEYPGEYFALTPCGSMSAPFGEACHIHDRALAEYVARTLDWKTHIREVRTY